MCDALRRERQLGSRTIGAALGPAARYAHAIGQYKDSKPNNKFVKRSCAVPLRSGVDQGGGGHREKQRRYLHGGDFGGRDLTFRELAMTSSLSGEMSPPKLVDADFLYRCAVPPGRHRILALVPRGLADAITSGRMDRIMVDAVPGPILRH